jgi:hypothetical protein
MAGLFQISEIEAKKRALTIESEIYRQSLKLQAQNLRICATGLSRRYTSGPLVRLLRVAVTLLGSSLGRMILPKRRSRWMRLVAAALLGWQAYQKVAPLLQGFFPRRTSGPRSETDAVEP